jgi:hypothetical protein
VVARLAAVLLAGAVLAGTAAAKDPRRAYTAAGTAQAKAIALKLSDLPAGWKVDRASGGSGGNLTCPGFDPDESDLTSIGHVDASFASRDGLSNVLSVVGVFKTAAEGRASWSRVVRPGVLRCLTKLFEEGASDKSTTTKVVSSGKLSLPLDAPRKAAYRIAADVSTQGQHVKAYLDVILQGAGRADTVLLVTSVLVPPQTAFEWKLAGTVSSRLT